MLHTFSTERQPSDDQQPAHTQCTQLNRNATRVRTHMRDGWKRGGREISRAGNALPDETTADEETVSVEKQ